MIWTALASMVSFFGSSTSGVYGVHAVDIKKCVAMYYAYRLCLLCVVVSIAPLMRSL